MTAASVSRYLVSARTFARMSALRTRKARGLSESFITSRKCTPARQPHAAPGHVPTPVVWQPRLVGATAHGERRDCRVRQQLPGAAAGSRAEVLSGRQ